MIQNTISLTGVIDSNLDHSFLRQKGREIIEKISSQIWTDYNTHDPGITILDMLCYAITDLAARTHLPIEDLIAEADDASFFTPIMTLPNGAITFRDYRKVMLDLARLRDGKLLLGRSEVPLYFVGGATTYEPVDPTQPDSDRIYLRGLLDASIELPGSLNEDWIEQEVTLAAGQVVILHYYFDNYDQSAPIWFSPHTITKIDILGDTPTPVEDESDPDELYDRFFVEAIITFSDGTILGTQQSPLEFWILVKQPITAQEDIDAIAVHIRNAFATLGPDNPAQTYKTRLRKTRREAGHILHDLQDHRNLGEDWVRSQMAGIQKIGICIEELELKAGFNPEKIVGRIYSEVDQFLSPFINPQSLPELLAAGLSPETIFDGPLLNRGFLTAERIKDKERNGLIYTSDILALIMGIEIEGEQPIIGVKGLKIISYINRYEVAHDVQNCLRPRNRNLYKVKFSSFHSKVTVSQPGYVSTSDNSRSIGVARYYELKEELEQPVSPGVADIPVKLGKKRGIEDYYSIQHDFPAAYKLREGALTDKDTPLRTAQARQMKAYLLFFEQFFADYCSQLARLQELFSIDPAVSRTYFFQPLGMVPEVTSVIEDFQDYTTQLGDISESNETFLQRRHQMIDHLLARLGEDFSTYAVRAYQATHDYQLLRDKLTFLNEYTSFTGQRAKGFNYCKTQKGGAPDVWDTANVSGFEKRVCRLLGIIDCRRRSLAGTSNIQDHIQTYDEIDTRPDGIYEARFRIRELPIAQNPESKILLSSSKRYPFSQGLSEELTQVLLYISRRENYVIFRDKNDNNYYFNLVDDTGETIARRIEPFDSELEAEREIYRIINHIGVGRSTEGMHVVEHILLRPRDNTYELISPSDFPFLSQPAEDDSVPVSNYLNDIYSCQLSIILPGYAGRSRDLGFRTLVEEMIRMELPAHLMAYIVWVEQPERMVAFEEAYRPWLESLCIRKNLKGTNDALIAQLRLLNSSPDR